MTQPGKNLNMRNPAIKRILQEFREFQKDPHPNIIAAPLEDNVFDWHFTIRGASGTDFEGGRYHGRIILPSEYPFKPPDLMMLTPSGRFQTQTKICLSISGFHPNNWQPSWSVRTMLIALIAFFPTPPAGAIGSLDYPSKERQRLAKLSGDWCCELCKKSNKELLPDLTDDQKQEQSQAQAKDKATLSHLAASNPTPLSPISAPLPANEPHSAPAAAGHPSLRISRSMEPLGMPQPLLSPETPLSPPPSMLLPLNSPPTPVSAPLRASASMELKEQPLAAVVSTPAPAPAPAAVSVASPAAQPMSPTSAPTSSPATPTTTVLSPSSKQPIRKPNDHLFSLLTVLLSVVILILLIRKFFLRAPVPLNHL
jgi:ubiquitin-conjugating enzyme E2 J1